MNYAEESLKRHYTWGGKMETIPKMPIATKEDLSLAYTPGVAEPCLRIRDDVQESFKLTQRKNTVAVVTDGTAVLGLGDIGPEAAMPVMEGKCALFKAFGGVDAIPLCIRSKDVDVIVQTVQLLAGSFGGINLEDISAPRCFEVEEKLRATLDIPVFHDDQHGTAVVTLAAVLGALKLTGRDITKTRAVFSGAGAAGTATAKLLRSCGMTDIIMVASRGIIHPDEPWLTKPQAELATWTNPEKLRGSLADACRGRDLFIGLSAPGILSQDAVRAMNADPIVFPMANPTPEIMPDLAREAGAAIIGTGRSDFPNQINNVLAFPGIFRGTFQAGAKDITEAMKIAAARAIADLAAEDGLDTEHLLPEPFHPLLGERVASAVARAAG